MTDNGSNIVEFRSRLDSDQLAKFPPAAPSEIMEMISYLFDAFPATPKSETSAEMQVRAYTMAVEELPLESIKRAVVAFIRGDVLDHNKRFTPSSAELASEARRQFFAMVFEDRKGGR